MTLRIPQLVGGILNRKAATQILILGAYKPKVAQASLVRLRDYLRHNGYKKSYLLRNLRYRKRLPGERIDVYFTLKGRAYLSNWANIALFVFRCEVNNMGVLSEFDFVLYKLPRLMRTSTVFIDENCHFPSLTTSGTIQISACNQRFFQNEAALRSAARSECVTHLRNLY